MAILKGPIQLEGKVGGLIFYRRGNKTCCRSMPQYKPGSMTAASKQSAVEFGRASKAGKLLREALNGLWTARYDSGMVNRLNKAMYLALRQDTAHDRGGRVITPAALQEALKGFRFNNKASLHFRTHTERLANGDIVITLPPAWLQLLRRPRFASHVQLQVAAICPDFESGSYHKAIAATPVTALDTKKVPVQPPLQLSIKGKGPVVVVLQVRFIKMEHNNVLYTSADLACMPCCVIAVCPPHKKQHTRPRRAPKKARTVLQ